MTQVSSFFSKIAKKDLQHLEVYQSSESMRHYCLDRKFKLEFLQTDISNILMVIYIR